MDRRDFIKFTAASGASATLAGCGNPEFKLIRFIPEETLVPGVAVWRPSVCPLCSAGCGMLVRVMPGEAEVVRDGQLGLIRMGLAKKLEGNPAHPVNRGKLCVRGQAAIQVTYHPDRINRPLKRSGERGSGEFQQITWDEALAELVSQLDALAERTQQESLAFLTRPLSGQRQTLVSRFLSGFGAPPPLEFEMFEERVLRRANARSFGYEQLPTFDLAESRYVIAFGADFLGTWNSPVSQNLGFGDMRRGRPGIRAKFVQVEPRMSQTGANADEWVPARPGTEGVLALGLAHVIINAGLRSAAAAGGAGTQIEGWSGGLPAYTPAEVERLTGVAAARIERLAHELAEHSPSVAMVGGAPLAHTNALFTAIAVNALNALVGSVGAPGGLYFTPRPDFGPGSAGGTRREYSIETLAADILSNQGQAVQLLMVSGANPVFATPPAWRVREALSTIPFIVSFGSFVDETSVLADLILPDHSFLESWVDHVPETGAKVAVASLAAPAMRPLHQTRAMPDVLLDVAGRLSRPLDPALPWESYEEMLQMAFASLPAQAGAAAAADAFRAAQEQGGWWDETAASPVALTPAENQSAAAFVEPAFDGDAGEYPYHFLPYASQQFVDGSVAHLPLLQETPDVLSTAMWSSWIDINPQTAAGLGIAQGDLVEITSTQGTLRAPAFISPAIAPDVIAMPVGQGHENFTRYASGRGSNPIRILAPVLEPETGALAWAATRVRISKVDGRGDLILFGGALAEYHGGRR